MRTQTSSILIICLAIVIAAWILFVKKDVPKTTVNSLPDTESAVEESTAGEPVNSLVSAEEKEETEFDRRQEIRSQYQKYSTEEAPLFIKPIDKFYLLANQYNFGSSKYPADTNTGLNTAKLTEISASDFAGIVQKGIDLKSRLDKNPVFVTKEKTCTNIKLDNGGYSSFCDPENKDFGMYYTYYGFDKNLGLHLLSYSIEESASFLVSQKNGNKIDVTFHRQLLSPDGNILVSYNPEFGGAYTQGGISVIDFKDYASKNIMQVYGGYAGFERWGIEDVKIDSSNVIYFKTVAFSDQKDSAGNLIKTHSYFKQVIK